MGIEHFIHHLEITGMEHYTGSGNYRDRTNDREITGTDYYTWSGNYRDGIMSNLESKLPVSDKLVVTDTLMEVYKFIRTLTAITGTEFYKCITRGWICFETLTNICTSRAASSQLKIYIKPAKIFTVLLVAPLSSTIVWLAWFEF